MRRRPFSHASVTLSRSAGKRKRTNGRSSRVNLTRTEITGRMSRCPNCSADRTDEYCPRCGQRRIDPEELSVRHFLNELADEVTDFRTKFKTGRTLWTLVMPGLLTAEFLAGRRQRYLSPFKTYLVCAAMFFLLAPVAGFTLTSMADSDR